MKYTKKIMLIALFIFSVVSFGEENFLYLDKSESIKPAGSSQTHINEAVKFSVQNTLSSTRGTVLYRFDFGDGSQSSWSKSGTISHKFNRHGTFFIKSQAKLETTNAISEWSESKIITVEPRKILLTIKECAGVGTKLYPITTVIPFPYGAYQKTDTFGIEDEFQNHIPAQFEVLNRWTGDNSIRHVKVIFQVSVDPFTGPGTGISNYYFKDDGNVKPSTVLAVDDNPYYIRINTGPLVLIINKYDFNILERVVVNHYEIINREQNKGNGGIFVPRAGAGDVQYDCKRNDVKFTIEESGPMRAVIRAESLTKFHSKTDHVHGFAVRIYAFVGKTYIKVDYQLQNSAKNVKYSWPLYFEEMKLDFQLNLAEEANVSFGRGNGSTFTRKNGNGLYLAQERHNNFKIYEMGTPPTLLENNTTPNGKGSDGYININDGYAGIMAAVRYCWQTWPNGLALDKNNKLSIQLFPSWSQCYSQDDEHGLVPNEKGLYWLEDMQHTYKEVFLYFYTDAQQKKEIEFKKLANTFDYHPIAVLPVNWYKETKALLDLDGVIPINSWIGKDQKRKPDYHYTCYEEDSSYNFGWDNFLVQMWRKGHTNTTGGLPYTVASFIGTGDASDYYYYEQQSIGELNVHPEWISGYKYKDDFEKLKLTSNPYGGSSWRCFEGFNTIPLVDKYLDGTKQDSNPRDDQHGWFGEVEEIYYLNANPWIKDWYKFIGEFRKTRLNQMDPFPDMVMRAIGHSLHSAFQAYLVTGDKEILELFKKYLIEILRPLQIKAKHGGSDAKGSGEAYMAGFLARPIIMFMREIEHSDPEAYGEAFNYIAGMVDWNYHWCNFAYSWDGPPNTGISNGTGASFVDIQAWFYWNTGRTKYLDQIVRYMNAGLSEGNQPYFENQLNEWGKDLNYDYVGRFMSYVNKNKASRNNSVPGGVRDLKVTANGGVITASWTAPVNVKKYHIVYSDTPISKDYVFPVKDKINWWAARALNQKIAAKPGTRQSFSFVPGYSGTCYIGIIVFDDSNNMSEIVIGSNE